MKLGFDPEKYRFAFVPGVIILVALLTLVVFLPKQAKFLSNQNKQLQRTNQQIQELKQKYLLLSSLDKQKLKEQAKIAVKALPEDKNIPLILQNVRESVTSPGFLIEELSFSPGEIEKDAEVEPRVKRVEELSISMKIIGNTDNLLDLLDSIEKRLPLLEVTNFEVKEVGKISDRVEIELGLITFYSPPVKAKSVDEVKPDELVLNEKQLELVNKLEKFTLTELKTVDVPVGTDSGQGRENPFEL